MKKEKTLTTLLLLITVFVFTGLAYAYLGGGISNLNKQTAQITTGTMNLTFADGSAALNATQMTIGESVTKTFTIENTGTLDAKASMYFKDLVNTYMAESMSYRLEQSTSENGTYSVIKPEKNVPQSSTASEKLLYGNITVPAGTKLYYKLIITFNNLPDVDQTQDIDAILNTKFTLKAGTAREPGEGDVTLAALGLQESKGTPNFFPITYETITVWCQEEGMPPYEYCNQDGTGYDKECALEACPYTSEEECNNNLSDDEMSSEYCANYEIEIATKNSANGIFAYEDNYGTSFVFNNNPKNVIFGTDETNEDLTWEIIRINGDGTLRMILTTPITRINYDNGFESFDSNYYLDWTELKNKIEEWYRNNLLDNYNQFISQSTMFCADMNYTQSCNNTTIDDCYGHIYDAYYRLEKEQNFSPTLYCNPPKAGQNNGETQLTIQNGLTYPIALITADEELLMAAQKNWGTTLTPRTDYNIYSIVAPYVYHSNIDIYHDSEDPIHPVINLTAEYARTLMWDSTKNAYVSNS